MKQILLLKVYLQEVFDLQREWEQIEQSVEGWNEKGLRYKVQGRENLSCALHRELYTVHPILSNCGPPIAPNSATPWA